MAESSLDALDCAAEMAGVKGSTALCHQSSFLQREGKVAGVSKPFVPCQLRYQYDPLAGSFAMPCMSMREIARRISSRPMEVRFTAKMVEVHM
jgi:hypothetical protein